MTDKLRIVSLIPSATEIVCALGFKEYIVGRSHECDFPSDIQAIPICTQSLVDSTFDSKKIDEDVRYRLINGLSIYQLNLDLISQLNPHLIITQSQCSVCAIDVDELNKYFAILPEFSKNIKIVTLKAKDLEPIFDDIQRIADALEESTRGLSLITHLKSELHKLHTSCLSLSYHPRVACIEWIEPLMAAGNWIPSLVELAGAENLFSAKGKPSPWIKAEDLISENPDIIIIMACGFNIERTMKEMKGFLYNEMFKKLKAVENKQFFLVDANYFFVRPGPRIVDSLKILCEIIHPTHFHPTYKGVGWQNYVDAANNAYALQER